MNMFIGYFYLEIRKSCYKEIYGGKFNINNRYS